jgi:hypothetical protein
MDSDESLAHGTKTRRTGARVRDVAVCKSCGEVKNREVGRRIGDVFPTNEERGYRVGEGGASDDLLDTLDDANLR